GRSSAAREARRRRGEASRALGGDASVHGSALLRRAGAASGLSEERAPLGLAMPYPHTRKRSTKPLGANHENVKQRFGSPRVDPRLCICALRASGNRV